MSHTLSSVLRGGVLALAGLFMLAGPAGAQSVPMSESAEAGLSLRISELEDQVRRLTGQVEQIAHVLRRLEERSGVDTGYLGQNDTAESGSLAQRPDHMNSGSGDDVFGRDGNEGSQPQILGQVPGQPLDLSGALGQPLEGYGNAAEFARAPGSGGDTLLAAAPSSGDPRADYDMAYGHVLRGEFEIAQASFEQFLDSYPDDELAGNARYWLGESLYARGRYRDAADAFLAGFTQHPDNAKAPDSLFKLGMSLKELDQRDAACASLAEVGRKYPEASQAVRERALNEMEKSGC